jgi:hypothetical protein
MEREFPEIVEVQPELLARHCAEAGLIEKAVMFWCKAGQQAIGRGAMNEAVAQLRKSLDLISGLPDGTERQERELIVQITFGQVLMVAKGLAAPEVNETFARARYLCGQLHRPPQLDVLTGQISYNVVRGNLERGEYHAQEMRQLGETHGDMTWRCFGFLLGGSLVSTLASSSRPASTTRTLSCHGMRSFAPSGQTLMIRMYWD